MNNKIRRQPIVVLSHPENSKLYDFVCNSIFD